MEGDNGMKTPVIPDDVVTQIVNDIVQDLSDRRGLGQEWDQIDDDIQAEIREVWASKIRAALTAAYPVLTVKLEAAKRVCDSYAAENQRLSDERDAALTAVKAAKEALDGVRNWFEIVRRHCEKPWPVDHDFQDERETFHDDAVSQIAKLEPALATLKAVLND